VPIAMQLFSHFINLLGKKPSRSIKWIDIYIYVTVNSSIRKIFNFLVNLLNNYEFIPLFYKLGNLQIFWFDEFTVTYTQQFCDIWIRIGINGHVSTNLTIYNTKVLIDSSRHTTFWDSPLYLKCQKIKNNYRYHRTCSLHSIPLKQWNDTYRYKLHHTIFLMLWHEFHLIP
jgi:hypothetical protein